MRTYDFTHTSSDEGGRYALMLDGHEAYLTYVRPRDGVILITHTIVPDALGGRGLGKKLVTRAMEDAIADGLKVASTCWFATALIEKNADWKAIAA